MRRLDVDDSALRGWMFQPCPNRGNGVPRTRALGHMNDKILAGRPVGNCDLKPAFCAGLKDSPDTQMPGDRLVMDCRPVEQSKDPFR